MKLLVKSDLFEVEVEGQTAQEVWQRAAFWHSLPTVCPVDGSPVRFGYANRGGYDFHFLESTGERRYEFPFGTDLESKSLFPGKVTKFPDGTKKTVQKWTYWDAENEREVIVWQDGRLIVDGAVSKAPAQRAPEPAMQQSDAEIAAILPTQTATVREVGGVDTKAAAYKVFDDMGQSLYNQQWTMVAKRNAKRVSNSRTEDPRGLSVEELNKLSDGLRKMIQEREALPAF